MADDVASFGFDVDSAPLTKGALALKMMSTNADEATQSSKEFAAAQPTVARASKQVADEIKRLTDANENLAAANDNLVAANNNVNKSFVETNKGMQETKRSFFETAAHVASVASQFKLLAVAAYALIPTLRGVVNTGLVNTFSAVGPAVGSAAVAIGSKLAPAVSLFARLGLPILAVVGFVTSLIESFSVGAERIKDWNELAQKAFARGVTSEFFQQATKAADAFNISVDSAAKAMEKFNDVSTPTLGGSTLANRLDELTKAGNFKGNTGVDAFKSAGDTEERYRAMVSLITQAMKAGERLAALDLAEKFLPPDMLNRLRANNDLLAQMQEKADKIHPLVSKEDIETAELLTIRMKAARDIMGDELLPINRDMAKTGLQLQAQWIYLNELFAQGVIAANKMYEWFAGIPQALSEAGSSSFWTKLNDWIKANGLDFKLPGTMTAEEFNEMHNGNAKLISDTEALAVARAKLTKGLTEYNLAQMKINAAAKDTSINPEKDKSDQNNPLDRAANQIRQRTAAMKADIETVGLGVQAHEEFRVKAILEEARIRSSVEAIKLSKMSTEEQTEAIRKLGEEAGRTKYELAQKQAQDKANFELQTIGLDETEKAIASINRELHGNEWHNYMNDGLAATKRMTDALKTLQNAASEALKGFISDLRAGKSPLDALLSSLVNFSDKMVNLGMDKMVGAFFGTNGMKSMFASNGGNSGTSIFGFGNSSEGSMGAGGTNLPATWSDGGGTAATGVGGLSGTAGGYAVGGLAAVGAGIGAYRGGQAAGSPSKGALNGALAGGLAGASLGFMVGGPVGAAIGAGIGAIGGAVTGFLGGKAGKKEQEQQDRLAAQDRANQYQMQAQLAGINTSTFDGSLQAFDIQAAAARLKEAQQKFPQMVALEQQLAAQRLAIYKQFNDAVLAQAKEIRDFAQSLKTSDLSTLSPKQKLDELQTKFEKDYAASLAGDHDASGRLTQDADQFLQAAKLFYASSTQYADIFDNVFNKLSTFQGVLYANGGRVYGGTPGVDSVPIMAQQDEFVVNADSARKNMRLLTAINENKLSRFANGGAVMPTITTAAFQQRSSNDNYGQNFDNLARVLAQGFNGQTAALLEGLASLEARFKKLDDSIKEGTAEGRKQRRKGAT